MNSEAVQLHLKNGDLTLARVTAEAELATAATAEQGLLNAFLARIFVRLGQPRRALEAAEKATASTTHWQAGLAMAEALIAMGTPLPAKALLSELLRDARDGQALSRPSQTLINLEVVVGPAVAEACRAAGDAATGVTLARHALSWSERYTGHDSLETAEILHVLGVCLSGTTDHDGAWEMLTRSSQIRHLHAPTSADVAATLDALGTVLRHLGRPNEAVSHHRDALRIWQTHVSEHASPIGACRHSLAQALHRTGDFSEAHAEMKKAASITAKTLGEDHVDTWITRFELGRFEMDVGMHLEGLARMEDARKIVAERLGGYHPVVQSMDRWL